MEKKVVVVDDNQDSRDMLSILLKAEGYAVYTASDGQEALKLISLDCPDLIITDINMPKMTGIELIKTIRELPECSALPIMVMTAFGSGRLSDALDAGADQALKKPLDYESFIQGINRLLSE